MNTIQALITRTEVVPLYHLYVIGTPGRKVRLSMRALTFDDAMVLQRSVKLLPGREFLMERI